MPATRQARVLYTEGKLRNNRITRLSDHGVPGFPSCRGYRRLQSSPLGGWRTMSISRAFLTVRPCDPNPCHALLLSVPRRFFSFAFRIIHRDVPSRNTLWRRGDIGHLIPPRSSPGTRSNPPAFVFRSPYKVDPSSPGGILRKGRPYRHPRG